MKQRILYIDELKGFAIFLVVVGHVFQFSFGVKGSDYVSVWLDFISSFHMPLFAFLSGLFIKEITSWQQLRKLLERFGLPMLVVGSVYTLWRGKALVDFFFNEFKFGYWYFLFLFTAYVIVTLLEKIARRVKTRNQRGTFMVVASSVYALILLGGVNTSSQYLDLVGYSHLRSYMPYIFMGLYMKKFVDFDRLFSCRHLFDIAVMLAFVAFVVRHYLHHGTAVYLMGPCMVFVVVSLFYRYRDVASPIKKVLQWWGKSSLEIYCLHYFLLHTCTFPFVYQATMNNNAETIEFAAASLFAVFMCCTCVYVGNVIKTSEWLGYLCFGNKNACNK